jgi:predicted DNA-binding protein
MELSKKTTILLTPELHEKLRKIAKNQGVSMGWLVRKACEAQYDYFSDEARGEAVAQLATLSLPVGSTEEMKAQSVPDPGDLGQ